MGVRFFQSWEGPDGGNITLTSVRSFKVSGYDHIARLPQYSNVDQRVDTLEGGICVKKGEGLSTILFTLPDTSKHLLSVDLSAHADAILKDHRQSSITSIPDSVMMVRASGNGLSVCICPWTLQVWRHDGKHRVNYLEAVVLYSVSPTR
jgi:hypothetical protein